MRKLNSAFIHKDLIASPKTRNDVLPGYFSRLIRSAVIASLLCFCLFLSADVFASDSDRNVARIQKAYEKIKDLKGSFHQKSILKDIDRTDIYSGDFYIKYPLKMKWIYNDPTSQEVTIVDNAMLIYKKHEQQAYKGTFDRQTYGQTPVALLSGFGSLTDEFEVSGDGNQLILRPKKPLSNVESITVTLSDSHFPIDSFTIRDSYANIIEITLKNIKTNTDIKDSLFTFSLPDGVNVFEQ
jgi:outer membrane lipoprotein carrier protein